MKKKHMQRHIDSLVRQLDALQARILREHAAKDNRFESAMFSMKTGEDVLIVTPSGGLVRATVTEVGSEVDMIDTSNGITKSFLPGRRTLRIQLEPKPGLFDE